MNEHYGIAPTTDIVTTPPLPRTRLKILYVAGAGRSGSTILGAMLGAVPGFIHVGELGRIWEEGFIRNFRCGCGVAFDECCFWTAVLDQALGHRDAVDPQQIVSATRRWARARYSPALLTARGRRATRAGLAAYTAAMESIYGAIARVTQSHVIVDSSKAPFLAWLAAAYPTVDLFTVHLIRDPRAVVHSWRRRKFDPARGGDMARAGPIRPSLAWVVGNVWTEVLGWSPLRRERYLRIHYEDLVAEPVAACRRILGWLGETTDATLPFEANGDLRLSVSHTIGGNPVRFKRGSMQLAVDDEWRSGEPWSDRLLVTVLTWPLLAHYGYSRLL